MAVDNRFHAYLVLKPYIEYEGMENWLEEQLQSLGGVFQRHEGRKGKLAKYPFDFEILWSDDEVVQPACIRSVWGNKRELCDLPKKAYPCRVIHLVFDLDHFDGKKSDFDVEYDVRITKRYRSWISHKLYDVEAISSELFMLMHMMYPDYMQPEECFVRFRRFCQKFYPAHVFLEDWAYEYAGLETYYATSTLAETVGWYNSFEGVRSEVSTNSVGKFVCACTRLFRRTEHLGHDEAHLLWAIVALESLLNDGSGASGKQLAEKAVMLLHGEDEEKIRKQMKSLYSFRSKLFHGNAPLVSITRNEWHLDEIWRVRDGPDDMTLMTSFSVVAVLSILAELMSRNCQELSFKYGIEYH